MLTWRSHDATRIESTRVLLVGDRIKAVGRIVAAATAQQPAFSASYDLVTDDSGATKRLSLNVTLAERDRQLSIARDEENMWLVTDHEGQWADSVTLPVVYVYLPELTVSAASISYSSPGPAAGDGIKLHSPVAETTVVVDNDGFILDYPGLAERI
ncbi:MAG: putative glycolipid-binding domain-containing protein [Mycobacterium sp.]|nr:putative glycolipid-binding domain-containing protein [Mycobacterium sp.]